MIKVNALGDACPIPVVKTKNAIKELKGSGQVETLVDNEIAVQNLAKMANQKGYQIFSEKIREGEFRVVMTVSSDMPDEQAENRLPEEPVTCLPDAGKNITVVISSDKMGEGSDELGKALLKGFIFALSQQDELPSVILLYNGGARMSTEGSQALEDLRSMEARGVEILTCGTCLNHYGLTEKLAVGSVTNMYAIVEKMMQASMIIKP
ncbi:MAG: sulfurtransferase-like selenium metabolism protein YedF [Eubacterium sp.]|nr:sulfurtransferase-like selenium metabolism protein YedF [Eubacterium sp.]